MVNIHELMLGNAKSCVVPRIQRKASLRVLRQECPLPILGGPGLSPGQKILIGENLILYCINFQYVYLMQHEVPYTLQFYVHA